MTNLSPGALAWSQDRSIVRYPDPAVETVDPRFEQYRLGGITFSGNKEVTNVKALRSLFPMKDGDIFSREKVAKGLENLDRAGLEQFNQDLLRIHRTSLLAPYIELAYTGAIVLNKDDLSDKLELNSRVMHFAPISIVVFQQAILLALNGQAPAAKAQLERAAVAYPGELENFTKVMHLLLAQHPAEFEPLLELANQKLKEYEIAVRAK